MFGEGKIAVYYINTQIPKLEILEFATTLSLEEGIRAKRFRFLQDANRYIVKHAGLRLLLSSYIGCQPSQVDICTSNNGKPYLVCQGCPEIYFNVSSSESFAVFAFNQSGEIGVDIEKICRIPDMLEIVERYFTQQEKFIMSSCPDSLRLSLFYKFWTRKEAVLKAQGEGLLKSLDSVDVSSACDSAEPRSVQITANNISEKFSVKDLDGPAGYAVALAVTGTIENILVKQVDY